MSDQLPERRQPEGEKLVASFSAEQTARFFRGEPLGQPEWADPEVAKRMARQREALRRAMDESIKAFVEALRVESAQSAHRLEVLGAGALAGDQYKLRLFVAMYTELLYQALNT